MTIGRRELLHRFFFFFRFSSFPFVRIFFFLPLVRFSPMKFMVIFMFIFARFVVGDRVLVMARARAHNLLIPNDQTRKRTDESVHLTLVWILCAENGLYFMRPYFSSIATDEQRAAPAHTGGFVVFLFFFFLCSIIYSNFFVPMLRDTARITILMNKKNTQLSVGPEIARKNCAIARQIQ